MSSECLFLSSISRFAGAFALRQRMLNFVQNIQYYMMFEVMEPTWHIMENNLKSVSRIHFIQFLYLEEHRERLRTLFVLHHRSGT